MPIKGLRGGVFLGIGESLTGRDSFEMLKLTLNCVLLGLVASAWAMNVPLFEEHMPLDFHYEDALARFGQAAVRAPVSSQLVG